MLRFSALCVTVVAVLFVLSDVCGVQLRDYSLRGMASQVKSLVAAVER